MTGKEMLSQFIVSLNDYLGFSDETVLENVIIDEDLKAALTRLKSLTPPPNFVKLIDSLDTIINSNKDNFLSETYSVTGSIEIVDFSIASLEKKNRAFAYSDNDFGYFSTKSLIQSGSIVDISLPHYAMLWKQIQEFLERCYSNADTPRITLFLDCIRNNNFNLGFTINKQLSPFSADRHYSYIYLCFLNNSKSIDLPIDIIYSTPQLNNKLSLDSSKIYEQFFDIYDVLNELNQAPDILSRFLKLYHILEYFVYRVYLVDLTTRVGTNKFFVREFAISAESMKGKEKSTFIDNFQIIFNANRAAIKLELDPVSTHDAKTFLRDKGIVKGFDTSNFERVAALVYGLRCSIVHNKESEYHLTITNSEDYKDIIPLIKQLIKTLEFLVIKKIADNDDSIKYPKQQMSLY
ncbi:MAG: hypothetical protein C0459_12925 [Chitinophaga sp.]|jgi:hypothetical protein|nr:hypothetical protein [Chitinophaga sp.]